MAVKDASWFFSVNFKFIVLDEPVSYDLYINSSRREGSERFIRIFPMGESLSKDDLTDFRKKYVQLYIPEKQRSQYLKSLVHAEDASDEEKTSVIKDAAIGYLDTLFDDDKEFTTEVLQETIDGCRDAVESMVDVLQDYDVSGIQQLIGNLSFHDFYTYDHSINVSMYCIGIFRALKPNATKDEIIQAGLGGLLHDLGKIKIPNEIINSPNKLTDEQFALIQKHPKYGHDLLHESEHECEGIDMDALGRVIHEHHENFNGTGYPNKLKGKDIHLMARITAIADFFDAITTKRSYHEVMSVQEAINVMYQSKGKKLDPKLFDIFVQNVKQMVRKDQIKFELPEDFDPCQPHEELPLTEVHKQSEKSDFGKITFMGDKDKKEKK